MRFSSAVAVAGAGVASVNAAALQGFNYGATLTTGAAKTQSDFETDFKKAQNLAGTSGWTSARLYTSIQGGSTNDPISAIPAAIATNTKLLLGIWASGGQEGVTNEIAAIENAVSQYGSKFTDLVVGLSVGSEDLYRVSPTGIINKSGVGAGPNTLVEYIDQVKSKNWGFPIGHVDTWNDWTNSSNNAVIEAVDWLGFDGYPYFESTLDNPIEKAESLFDASYEATVGAANGKPVWVTETGWPVSGDMSGQAEASTDNAEKYWKAVACKLIGETNTFWYTLRDSEPTTPSPSFGIIPNDINSDPLYDLSCSKKSTSSSSSKASSSSTKSASRSATASSSSSESTGIVGAGAGGHGPTVNNGTSASSGGSMASSSMASMAPVVTGTGSSEVGASGNSSSPSYSAGSPAASASTTGSTSYTGDAVSSTSGLSSLAAIIAFIGLVAHA
jgi:glucan endo-1,3-beta-D-glucosidase